MGYTDIRLRDLQAFLTAEIAGKPLSDEELRKATGVPRRQWGERRGAGDFPDPNELKSVARYFGLGRDGYANLLAEFGHIPSTMSRRVQALMTAQQLPPL